MKEISFVIPAWNEESKIGEVVSSIRDKYPVSEVIVVDDGSVDKTGVIAKEKGATVIRHVLNLGQWSALRTGFTAALMNKPDIVVTLDGDGQHDPGEIEKVLSPLLTDDADIVIGSRFIENGSPDMRGHRKVGIKAFNRILKLVTGIRVTDCTSGFKAMKASVIEDSLNMLSENQYGALEFLMCLNSRGFKLVEVPVKNISSDKSSKGSIRYGVNLLRTILDTKYW